jgi:exonuclease SbcC
MKLRSLSMHLFRQHVSTTVQFPDGLVGVIGTNGSGKTTILEAIGFALFGSKALRGRVEDVRTRTAPTKAGRGKRDHEMRVELSIEHDETVFRIERSLLDAALYVGGQASAVASGNREVSARISAIVGMSHDEFVATYCTEQKGLEFLSGKKGAVEREKFIIRMMGYNRLEEVQELLRSDRRDKRGVLQGYEASLGSREELEVRLLAEKEQLGRVREKHAEAVQALVKVESDFGVVHERMQRLEELRGQFLRERDGVQALNVRVEERAKRQRAIADSIVLAEDELARALKPLIGSRDFSEVMSETKRQMLVLREQTETIVVELQKAEVAWREELSGLQAERTMVHRQIEQLSKKIEKMGTLDSGGECPTCSQPLGESFENVSAHLAEELQKLRARLSEVASVELEKQSAPEDIDLKRKKHQTLVTSTERLSVKQQELQKCQQLEERLGMLRNEQRLVEVDIKSASENLERARQKLSEIKFSEEEFLKEKGAHDASQRLLEVARLQRVRLEGELGIHEALVTRSKEDLVKFDDRQAEVDTLRREVRIFDECDRIVTDFRKFVNSSIRPRMAELASEYLTDLTDGRYSAVDLEEDFTPTVVEDGEPKRVISGGEEDILNLCMRISLSHMLAERAGQNFSLLMLDEVFGSLDEVRRGNVLALLEKLRRRFEQIIIITHLDDIKDGVQHLIQVEYDEGSGSAVITNAYDMGADFDLALNV